MPTAWSPCRRRTSSNRARVRSTYGDSSMSMRTKTSDSRARSMMCSSCVRQRSGSMSRPICVSLMETCDARPSCLMRCRAPTMPAAASVASDLVWTCVPTRLRVASMPRAFRSRTTATPASRSSPATKRHARPRTPGVLMASFRSRGSCATSIRALLKALLLPVTGVWRGCDAPFRDDGIMTVRSVSMCHRRGDDPSQPPDPSRGPRVG